MKRVVFFSPSTDRTVYSLQALTDFTRNPVWLEQVVDGKTVRSWTQLGAEKENFGFSTKYKGQPITNIIVGGADDPEVNNKFFNVYVHGQHENTIFYEDIITDVGESNTTLFSYFLRCDLLSRAILRGNLFFWVEGCDDIIQLSLDYLNYVKPLAAEYKARRFEDLARIKKDPTIPIPAHLLKEDHRFDINEDMLLGNIELKRSQLEQVLSKSGLFSQSNINKDVYNIPKPTPIIRDKSTIETIDNKIPIDDKDLKSSIMEEVRTEISLQMKDMLSQIQNMMQPKRRKTRSKAIEAE